MQTLLKTPYWYGSSILHLGLAWGQTVPLQKQARYLNCPEVVGSDNAIVMNDCATERMREAFAAIGLPGVIPTPWEIDGRCTECGHLEERCQCPCVNCGCPVSEHGEEDC